MSKFYGNLESDRSSSTRTGHRYMEATARSWSGSIQATLSQDINGKILATVSVGRGSTTSMTKNIFGIIPIEDLLDGTVEIIVTNRNEKENCEREERSI